MTRFVAVILSIALVALGARTVYAQDYPNKPIRIVTSELGAGTDFTSRMIAAGVADRLGQAVIVENRGGNISAEIVAKGTADGYTLLAAGSSIWIGPLLRKTPYDPVKDFSPITLMTSSPSVLVVHPTVAARSVKELIALASARPGELNYGSGAIGGAPHLAGELFKAMAHVDIVGIPYKGAALALNAVIGGQVQMTFASAGTLGSHLTSGKLRALAVGSREPSALAPGLPTLAASGLAGYEAGTKNAMFAPAKTSSTIVSKLHQEIVRFIHTAGIKERLFNAGIEVVGSSPGQFSAELKSEMNRVGKVIKQANIRLD